MLLELFALLKSAVLYWLSFVLIVVPSRLKIPIYRLLYGHKIGSHVRIGFSWINVGKLEIGNHVMIHHFNRFKNIPEVSIGDFAAIGFGNTFTATAEFTDKHGIAARGNRPRLVIGRHCAITMFHYFDVQDSVTIGPYTTIAGRGSVFFTHYLDVIASTQSARPINIGQYCMVGSSVCFAPGAFVPDCCVVGMGAVVTGHFEDTHVLLGGNPAVVIKRLPQDAAYFTRTVGWIGPYASSPYRDID